MTTYSTAPLKSLSLAGASGVGRGLLEVPAMQVYSDPSRESEPHALPNVEVFHTDNYPAEDCEEPLADGWYWWPCFPGCLPDGEPMGPFKSAADALADAQDA
jgi:hypothetical protein